MSWIIDAANLLGRMRLDREAPDNKRQLLREVARFARAKRTRAVCVFDGPAPASFAAHLGNVRAEFPHPKSADDRIAELVAAAAGGCHVVTSDRALESRLRRRNVTVLTAEAFQKVLRELPRDDEGEKGGDDWESYFSDPQNRNV
jgi:hypothetical protein